MTRSGDVTISPQLNNIAVTSPSNSFHFIIREKIPTFLFQIASYLTDPICKAREFHKRLKIVEFQYSSSYALKITAIKCYLTSLMILNLCVSTLTSIPAIVMRKLAISIQKVPYIHLKNNTKEKVLENKEFSLLSWNICGIPAGYSITDGGVVPFSFRKKQVIDKIKETKADVVCLYEVFDINDGYYISKELKDIYGDVYINIGPKAVGVSSGMMVLSKFKIQNPEFISFPKEMLVGRTKNTEKGCFAFDIASNDKPFSKIFSTHLQHSEECDKPTKEEKKARADEMDLIMRKIKDTRDKAVVFTGDLNLDDTEKEESNWYTSFNKNAHALEEKTWPGDEFCAKLVNKRISKGLNLDHTMTLKGTTSSFNTVLVKTGYNPAVFNEEALSDHNGLLSTITIN